MAINLSAASDSPSSSVLLAPAPMTGRLSFWAIMVESFAPGYVFLFFCGMMVLQLAWVRTLVPETKGVPLEKTQRQLGIADPLT